MVTVTPFTFNVFMENTYVVHADSGECWIVDPGCYTASEQGDLKRFIADNGLKPVKLINTHCHLDHVFGNAWVHQTYGLAPVVHKGELPLLNAITDMGRMYGIPAEPSPQPGEFLTEGQTLTLGSAMFAVLLTPGHSPASVCLYCEADHILISGDVLFQGSIGRTDLPGGDYDTLMHSIETRLLTLPDHTVVYPGHGPETTIGRERKSNPFLQKRAF